MLSLNGDGGTAVCVPFMRLNHHGSNPQWENQSFYDLLDDKLVLAFGMLENQNAIILLSGNSSKEEPSTTSPIGGCNW